MRDEPLEHLHHHDPVPRDPVRRAGGVVRAPAPAARRRCARTPRAAPRRTHSAFSPGNATAYRMFEYGNDATRQCTSVRLPATTACAKPKSACITPGDHSNSRYPSPGSRCSCLQRFTYRCTIWYEPSNPCSSTSLSYTRLAVCRCLRGMNRSASNHLPINGLYGSSFETAAGRAGGSGEQSSNCAYLRTVCLDTPTSFDMRRQDTPLAPGNPDTLLYGRWHSHVLSFPRYLRMVASTRESSKTGQANASPRRQHDHMVNFSPITRPTNPR